MLEDYDFRAQRLHVTDDLAPAGTIGLSREQANYLINVLRLTDGAKIHVFNGRDGEWRAHLRREGKRQAHLEVEAQIRLQTAGPDIHYLFAPLKRARLDYVVQKATEMGVARLVPVITRHTVAERVNTDRMRANVIEAAEQCGILRIPDVAAPRPLDNLLHDWPAGRRLIFCDEAAPDRDPLRTLSGLSPGPLAVLIGPEGGFAPPERERLIALDGAVRLALGPRIMRADTAAVAALALVNAVLGDWRLAAPRET
ncbi:MAG: 16S rRNA (uracil(1498)-N(3))-methyltransferase [Hyphomicrobiaceae bacterium]